MSRFLLLPAALAVLLSACSAEEAVTDVAPPVVVTVLVTQPALPTETPAPTTTPEDRYPEPERVYTHAVHQLFERGDAVWLEDRREIWIFLQPYTLVVDALATPTGPRFLSTGGPLLVFADTFDANVDPDTDPNIVAPEGFIQPKGGIGKVWRADPELRSALGWALDWEAPYDTVVTTYFIEPDGSVQTVFTSDDRLLYVHAGAGIWSAGG